MVDTKAIEEAFADPATREHILFALHHAQEKFHIKFLEISKERTVASLPVTEDQINAFGIPYGAFLFNLADLTAGVAYLAWGGFGPTLNCSINFISASHPGDTFICTASLLRHGHKISFAKADITNQDGALLASAEFSFYTLESSRRG